MKSRRTRLSPKRPKILPNNWSSRYERIPENRSIFLRNSLMKKRFNVLPIVAKLRQADILIGNGKKIPEVCKEIDLS